MKSNYFLKFNLFLITIITSNVFSQENFTKSQCFEMMDKIVKECNGKKMTSDNHTQFYGSFTSEGYAILTDKIMYDKEDVTLYLYKEIQWDALISVNTRQLNFQYSGVCLKFSQGYYPYFQVCRTKFSYIKNKIENITNYQNPIKIKINDFPYKYIQNPYESQNGFTLYVRNQDAQKLVELIKRVSLLERSKTNNFQNNLTSKEKWNGDNLIKWNEDENGNLQGKYEIYNREGKLITYGNYRNNVRDGKWTVDGKPKNYNPINDNCMCSE
jgi:hypothetical protein